MDNKKPKIDVQKCIGCGVCSRFCNFDSLTMERRDDTRFVPTDAFERFVAALFRKGAA